MAGSRVITVRWMTQTPSIIAALDAVLLGLVRALPHSESTMDIGPATFPFGITIV